MSASQQSIERANPTAIAKKAANINWGLLAGVVAMIAVILLPTPAGLPVAGHRMLAILAFAVIVWMTEAIDYAVSAVVIAALMAFLLGFAQSCKSERQLYGHERSAHARIQRFCQYSAGPGRRRAVSRRSHDGYRARQENRADDPFSRRDQNNQCGDRNDSRWFRHRLPRPVNNRARILPRADYTRHHCRLWR